MREYGLLIQGPQAGLSTQEQERESWGAEGGRGLFPKVTESLKDSGLEEALRLPSSPAGGGEGGQVGA